MIISDCCTRLDIPQKTTFIKPNTIKIYHMREITIFSEIWLCWRCLLWKVWISFFKNGYANSDGVESIVNSEKYSPKQSGNRKDYKQ